MTGSFLEHDARQFERTSFAWVRTLLVMPAVAGLAIRGAEPGAERWLVGAGAGVTLAVSAVAFIARSRTLRRCALPLDSPPAPLAAIAGAFVVLAGSVAVIVL